MRKELLSSIVSASLKVSAIMKHVQPSSLLSNAIKNYWLERSGEHMYLEEVLGAEAIDWVKERNHHSIKALGNPESSPLYSRLLSILDSKEKIPYVRKIGNCYYNFWQDKENTRGILRRCSLENYKTIDPGWETVIDIDALGREENVSWVYKGYTINDINPKCRNPTRILLSLSRGGADATAVREFDLVTKKFVVGNGFVLSEAKNSVAWKEDDVLLVGTDAGDGHSMTNSGYPRVVREWRRGSAVNDAPIVFEGFIEDVSVSSHLQRHINYLVETRTRGLTFYTTKRLVKIHPHAGGFTELECAECQCMNDWRELTVPDDCTLSYFADSMLILLRSAWKISGSNNKAVREFPAGALIAVRVVEFLKLNTNAEFTVLFTPDERRSLDGYTCTKNYVILHTLENVRSRLSFWRYRGKDSGEYAVWEMAGAESGQGIIRGASLSAVDSDENDLFFLTTYSFTTPSSLHICDCDAISAAGTDEGDGSVVVRGELLKCLPELFNSAGLVETQGSAVSADGTLIPYFVISKPLSEVPADGSTPTLLYGYGGFEISLLPSYSAVVGAGWLEKGGAYVSANIRGGGEFGPTWHQAALKANRHLAYDDFIAVAEDLIKRGITSAPRLGIRGGSNGGLLMGNMLVRRPDLFGAVTCAVPLLDMRRYNKLLAGASWMAEYGDPDSADWDAFLWKFSAYHNIFPFQDAAKLLESVGEDAKEGARYSYPPLLMTTSTRDDRVHPYHARCFVKRLLDVGANEEGEGVYYYENIEGGHGGAADSKQQAFMNVLYLEFLWNRLNTK